ILAHPMQGPMEGEELRMGGRVAPFDGLVVSLGQDFPIRDDNGANWDFLTHRCHPSQSERGLHPREVAGRWCSPTHWPLWALAHSGQAGGVLQLALPGWCPPR